jgi:hypothetical protein
MPTLNWFDLSKISNGTRVVFAEAHDIFPECIVPAGSTATVTENGLNELACACIVTPDDPALRTALAEWEGNIWLTPPLDRSTGNREPDWHGASPLALL